MTSATPLSAAAASTLRTLLKEHEAYRSPAVLTVGTALEELAVALEEAAGGRVARASDDRTSLRDDVDRALGRAGAHLDAVPTPRLADLRRAQVSGVETVLQQPGACSSLAAVVRGVIDQLRSREGVEAAWDDLEDALRDGSLKVADCALRAAQLVELVELRGHDWKYLRMGGAAPGTASGRSALRAELAGDPPQDLSVVWVAFGNAFLDSGYIRKGQIQFFTDRLTMKNIRDGCPALNMPEFEAATELTDDAISSFFDPKAIEADPYVLARVEFTGPRAQKAPGDLRQSPIEWARDLALGVVEAAGFGWGGTEWVLLDGGCYFRANGQHAGAAGFGDPRRREALDSFVAPVGERTSEGLAALNSSLVDALARGDPQAQRAVQEVLWLRSVRAFANPVMRVGHYSRGFETQWLVDGSPWTNWTQPVAEYLKDHWVMDVMAGVLSRAASPIRLHSHFGVNSKAVIAARKEIYKDLGGNRFEWSPRRIIEHAPKVAPHFAEDSLARRGLEEVAHATSNGVTAQAWWGELRETFEVLLSRAGRQRNSLIHGRTVVPAVAGSVSPFLDRLMSYLAATIVHCAETGEDVGGALNTNRRQLAQQFDLVHQRSGTALFPAPE